MQRLFVVGVALASAVWFPCAATASQITDVTPASASTDGSTVITIRGNGFDAAGNLVTVGASPCAVTSETTDEIQCTVPEGSGASRSIRVIPAGGGAVGPPFPFAYTAPAITTVTAASAPTAGGTLLTIIGSNFGPDGVSRQATLVNIGMACTASPGESHTEMECTLPPGQGHDVPIQVTVDGQSASVPGSLSYDPPAITSVTPTRGPSAGGMRLTLTGNNFGSAGLVTVGAAACPVEVQSHTQLECTLPPAAPGAPSDVRLLVGGQASNSVPFSYQLVASKCDAAKFKAAASHAQCLAKAEATAATKGLAPDAAAVTKCDDKFTASCTKAETKLQGCSQTRHLRRPLARRQGLGRHDQGQHPVARSMPQDSTSARTARGRARASRGSTVSAALPRSPKGERSPL